MRNRLMKATVLTAAPKLLARLTGRRQRSWTDNATDWVGGLVGRRRRRPAVGRLALQGLGAAAVAVPLGIWVGRRLRSEQEVEETAHR